jgi:hypothetical protein
LAVLAYVKVHGVAPAAQRFGLDRKTVRTWRDRYRAHGEFGLVPRYPTRRPRRIPEETVALIAHARTEFRYGACRTPLWLIRIHERTLATKTITRICADLGLPPLQRVKCRRGPRQLTLFEKPHPGNSVQVDVKVVKLAGTTAYQYTALDDCTRLRVLRLYRRQNQVSSLEFFAEVRKAFPFPIRQLQVDGRAYRDAAEARGSIGSFLEEVYNHQRGCIRRSRTSAQPSSRPRCGPWRSLRRRRTLPISNRPALTTLPWARRSERRHEHISRRGHRTRGP